MRKTRILGPSPETAAATAPGRVAEEELGVRGFRFEVDFEDGRWRATAWTLEEVDPDGEADVWGEHASAGGGTPLEAFAALYDALVERLRA